MLVVEVVKEKHARKTGLRMKKVLLYILFVLVVVGGIMDYNYARKAAIPATGASPGLRPWQPAYLRIPRMDINAPVINVGRTASGTMDAPTSQALHSPYWTSVFWYDLGAAPGQPGNAVIAGHLDRVGGDPAIFWNLSSLAPGDRVYVTTRAGNELQFIVNRVVAYPANAPPQEAINAVFGPTTGHHLNLITCNGIWTGSGYDKRLVVFTTQL